MEVADIRGRCPIYKKGDKIVIDPVPNENVSVINLKETNAICTRIIGTHMLTTSFWMEYAKPLPDEGNLLPWHRALGPAACKCPVLGPPYSECGYCIFEMKGVPQTK